MRGERQVPAEEQVISRELMAELWRAFGCAWNPDDFKPSVRSRMWQQALEFARERHEEGSRIARENRELRELIASRESEVRALPDREVLAAEVDRLLGWQHLRKYAGMTEVWMDKLRDGVVRVVLTRIERDAPR